MLLKRIDIDRILITDSKVDLETTDDLNTGLAIPDIWFLAEGIHYNPVAVKDSNRIFYSDNIMAKVFNFEYVLPDNLSAIRPPKNVPTAPPRPTSRARMVPTSPVPIS